MATAVMATPTMAATITSTGAVIGASLR
jgi:hypothetical protein